MAKSVVQWEWLIPERERSVRRLRILYFDVCLFSEMFCGSPHAYSTDAPGDMRILAFRVTGRDIDCGMVQLLVWSNSFAEVPGEVWNVGSGVDFPVLHLTFTTYYPEEPPE